MLFKSDESKNWQFKLIFIFTFPSCGFPQWCDDEYDADDDDDDNDSEQTIHESII